MAIVKRVGPEGKLVARMGATWEQLLSVPIVAALVNPHFDWHVPADLTSLSVLISKFYGKDWISKVTWNEKIFLYVAGMVARRAGVPGFLSDDHMTHLARHMNATTTIDKISQNEVAVSLCPSMTFIYELPKFLEKHKTMRSLTLPPATPPRVPKSDAYLLMSYEQRAAYNKANDPQPIRNKLAKHRKSSLQSIVS